MKYKVDIRDEKHDEHKYDRLAKKNPRFKVALKSMADDEEKHAKMLKGMKSSKSRAIKKLKK